VGRKENWAVGVQRRSELAQCLVVNHKMGKGAVNFFGVHSALFDALLSDLGYVTLKRHRRSGDILTAGSRSTARNLPLEVIAICGILPVIPVTWQNNPARNRCTSSLATS